MKKHILLVPMLLGFSLLKAQKVDSIYVNLYTDSLKKGTYNYINIDGKLSNGRYLPLDSTHLIFTASAGSFSGNSLWIDRNFTQPKVHIKAVMRSNPAIVKEFDIWVKTMEDNEKLKSVDEILNSSRQSSGKKKKGKG